MPSEQTVLASGRWQPLPGAEGTSICPFESRPSLLTSNAYVLRGKDSIIVIDTGADTRQAARLCEIVNECLRQKRLPVLVILTHCHRDHVRCAAGLTINADVLVAAHETCARALASGDRALTMAEIFGEDAPTCDVPVILFPLHARARELPLADGGVLSIAPVPPGPRTGNLRAESLQIGRDSLLLLHTPGHSPDGVSILAGSVLFSGDLSVASRPLVAGTAGWDQPALVASLRGLLDLMRSGSVSVLAPGHAFSLPAAQADIILDRALHAAEGLRELERMDAARVRQLADYTRTLVGEIGDAIAVIAGRLDTAAFHLEALQEKSAAADALRALDVKAVDDVLDSFREHLGAVLDGRSLALSLPHKGMSTILRLDGALADPVLADYVSPLLLRRTRRMMADFIHMMYGMRQLPSVRPASLAALIEEAADLARSGGRQEGDLDPVAEDEAAFAKALGRRIVQQPVAADVEVVATLPDALPAVIVEADRFVELLTALLEFLAGQGATQAAFSAAPSGNTVRLSVTSTPPSAVSEIELRRFAYFDIVLRAQAGACRREGNAVLFDLPAGNRA